MSNQNLINGSVWRLHHGDEEILRLTVTGCDMPWVHAAVEASPGFDDFRALFADQEQAAEHGDWEQADACYDQIRASVTMTFPDGTPVPEFMVNVHGDGTASWRWTDEPFDEANTLGPSR